MGVLFTNLAMLAGLTALGLPILIHLLLKRKKQKLRFSTLQFFQHHDEQSSQRRKLRNLLLLAVRLLLLAVLVLAFARPYLPDGNPSAANQKRRLAVLVLDRSASMQAAEAGRTRWARAKDSLQKVLAELTANDRVALISCASHCEVLSGAAPPEMATRLLKDLQPTAGSGNIGEGLRLAARIVSSAGADAVSTIYIFSDLQLNSCKDLAAYPVPPEVEVRVIQAGDVLAPNLAITELQLDNREADKPHVLIASYSDEQAKPVNLKLLIDGKEILARPIEFATGNVARADLQMPPLMPGWHSGAVVLEGEDALALDNVRYDAFFVPQPLRTLLVETRAGKRVFEEESFFLTSALDPSGGDTNAVPSRFAIEKVSAEELLKRLANRTDPPNYDLVILPGLKQLPSGLGGALSEFVRAGGGLLLFLNEDVNASRYNGEFREFLPAQLGHPERPGTQAGNPKWHLDDYDARSAMFAPFRRPGSGNLALPEFSRRFTVVTNQAAQVSARFEDGSPAILTTAAGRGRVVLVNTSADTAWTDWPKHKTFVPWLHNLCFSLSARSGADQMRIATHLVAAPDHDVSLGAAAKGQAFRLQRLGEKELTLSADSDGRLPNVDLSKPGIYSIANNAGQVLQRLAVNLPPEESDLGALTPGEFQRQLARVGGGHPPTLAASFFGSADHRKDLARLLLIAALGLLFAETFLANRTYA